MKRALSNVFGLIGSIFVFIAIANPSWLFVIISVICFVGMMFTLPEPNE